MLVLSIAQVLLLSMVLGIHIEPRRKWESASFSTTPRKPPSPRLSSESYALSLMTDGAGLNACYCKAMWMVIHPPVLFLGFASTVIPFAFDSLEPLAGVEDDKTWIPAAYLPWTSAAAGALGDRRFFMGGAMGL